MSLHSSRIGRVLGRISPHASRLVRAGAIMLLACASGLTLLGFASPPPQVRAKAREEGLLAWQQVYSVLTSPRCINCHTATNYPQQGEDRQPHFAHVVRGPRGNGVPALQCVSCHQEANADSTGAPGGHNWHLAPLSMKWQDLNGQILSSGDVCRAVKDRSKNNNLSGAGLLKHHTKEPLVLWAWHPGCRPDGSMRTVPPLTHEQFVEATRKWVEAGMPCP
jgi:hypothetical protein